MYTLYYKYAICTHILIKNIVHVYPHTNAPGMIHTSRNYFLQKILFFNSTLVEIVNDNYLDRQSIVLIELSVVFTCLETLHFPNKKKYNSWLVGGVRKHTTLSCKTKRVLISLNNSHNVRNWRISEQLTKYTHCIYYMNTWQNKRENVRWPVPVSMYDYYWEFGMANMFPHHDTTDTSWHYMLPLVPVLFKIIIVQISHELITPIYLSRLVMNL